VRKRGKYSPEFREQAVKQAMSGSFTIKEVAESFGISYYGLRQWRAEFFFRLCESRGIRTKSGLKECPLKGT
jgi:transposase